MHTHARARPQTQLPSAATFFQELCKSHHFSLTRRNLAKHRYSFLALQRHFPEFRHNDVFWENIRAIGPAINSKTGAESSGMLAPIDPKTGLALTYTQYTVNGATFAVPNYGYSARIGDWDWAHAEKVPRAANRKVTPQSTYQCGRRLPPGLLWTAPVSVRNSPPVVESARSPPC